MSLWSLFHSLIAKSTVFLSGNFKAFVLCSFLMQPLKCCLSPLADTCWSAAAVVWSSAADSTGWEIRTPRAASCDLRSNMSGKEWVHYNLFLFLQCQMQNVLNTNLEHLTHFRTFIFSNSVKGTLQNISQSLWWLEVLHVLKILCISIQLNAFEPLLQLCLFLSRTPFWPTTRTLRRGSWTGWATWSSQCPSTAPVPPRLSRPGWLTRWLRPTGDPTMRSPWVERTKAPTSAIYRRTI